MSLDRSVLLYYPTLRSKNHYEALGIPVTASDSEIKSAYRQLAVKYHPDKIPVSQKTEAIGKDRDQCFNQISDALACLSDEKKRIAYDATLNLRQSSEACYDYQQACESINNFFKKNTFSIIMTLGMACVSAISLIYIFDIYARSLINSTSHIDLYQAALNTYKNYTVVNPPDRWYTINAEKIPITLAESSYSVICHEMTKNVPDKNILFGTLSGCHQLAFDNKHGPWKQTDKKFFSSLAIDTSVAFSMVFLTYIFGRIFHKYYLDKNFSFNALLNKEKYFMLLIAASCAIIGFLALTNCFGLFTLLIEKLTLQSICARACNDGYSYTDHLANNSTHTYQNTHQDLLGAALTPATTLEKVAAAALHIALPVTAVKLSQLAGLWCRKYCHPDNNPRNNNPYARYRV